MTNIPPRLPRQRRSTRFDLEAPPANARGDNRYPGRCSACRTHLGVRMGYFMTYFKSRVLLLVCFLCRQDENIAENFGAPDEVRKAARQRLADRRTAVARTEGKP